jgi:RNA polymerase sigma-70 factor, ECF subfamily
MNKDIRLIAAEIPRLRRYARAVLRDLDRADDLVQQTLIRALDERHPYRSSADLRARLFSVMHNHYVDHVRRRGRQREQMTDEKVRLTLPQTVSRELQHMDRAIQRLPDEEKTTLLLIALEGMSYEEVAQICNISVGTVRSRLNRARKELRQMMEAPDIRSAVRPKIPSLFDHTEAGDEIIP